MWVVPPNAQVQARGAAGARFARRHYGGVALGRAYRVPNVSVYVVGGSNADPDAELERALNDPDTETIIHWEGNEIAALVFVPAQARDGAGSGIRGVRADDV